MSEWVYFLHPPRVDFGATMTPSEEDVFGRHFEYLQQLLRDGVLVLAGPTRGESDTGIVVFEAPDEPTALAIMNGDPTISSGTVHGELRPMVVALLRGRDG